MLLIRIDKQLGARLAAVAGRTGCTKTTIARDAIAAKIKYLEELVAADAALHDAFRDGGEPLERIGKALNLKALPKNES
ncbi:MAG: hypothetical protein HEQ22_16125 [Sphingopyxis sp.]|uniref:hypothetical protein n=1 Tax=Sphingopyxis sp. TaxID=1908224 RepID=UPI003D80FA6B